MDTGQGKFKPVVDEAQKAVLERKFPDHGSIFQVGEMVRLKDSVFRIKSIKPTELRLKLVKRAA